MSESKHVPAWEQPLTQRQERYLRAVAREAGLDATALDDLAVKVCGQPVLQLSRRDASYLVDQIQQATEELSRP